MPDQQHMTTLRIATVVLSTMLASTLRAQATPEAWPDVPGSVIYHSPASSGIYIGSPGLCVLPDGTYLAKLDEFGPKSNEHVAAVTRIFRSADRGVTWSLLAKLDGVFWASLTIHRDALYLIGTTKEYGELIVRRSTDGGATWTTPSDAKHGLIRAGQWHSAPMPVIEHDGRIWRAFEYAQGEGWGERFRPTMMSIPLDGDLLDASQWTIAEPLVRDGKFLGGTFQFMLEGNAVVAPDGSVLDILRTQQGSLAAVAHVSADGKTIRYDASFDRTPIQGTDKKFEIRWDERSKLYFALCNPLAPADVHDGDPGGARNTLALLSSPDLKNWTRRTILLHHDDPAKYAFQYVDWLFDGDDLIVASRTAYEDGVGGAHRGHDANFLTFHRFPKFRDLTSNDGPQLAELKRESKEVGDLTITGSRVQVATLRDGERAFGNRDYVWEGVPKPLIGATFIRTDGGADNALTVTAKQDTALTIAIADLKTATPTGFTAQPAWTFAYSDKGMTKVRVFTKPMKAGDELKLPGETWSGSILIVTAK